MVAWVGKSVVFRGDLISSEDMTIDGRVEGMWMILQQAEPDDYVLVTVFGKVSGSVAAEERVEIRQGATVEADITCQTLAIQEGAFFCGKVAMSGRQAKTDTSASEGVATPAAQN